MGIFQILRSALAEMHSSSVSICSLAWSRPQHTVWPSLCAGGVEGGQLQEPVELRGPDIETPGVRKAGGRFVQQVANPLTPE
jgi:hypothetical protein